MSAQHDPSRWDANHIPGRLAFKMLPGFSLSDVSGILANYNAEAHYCAQHLASLNIEVMEIPGDTEALAKDLLASGLVEWAEPDALVKPMFVPNDPGYPGNGGISGVEQYYLTQIGMTTAYNIQQGSASVIIASIDTHFYLAHPDMAGKFTSNGFNFTSNNSTLDTPGTCSDTLFHGCLTTAIAGAVTGNGSGMASVAPNCLIMPLQCAVNNSSTSPGISLFFAASAVTYAIAHGASVITMSFAGSVDVGTFKTALAAAWTAGLTLVAGMDDNGDQFINIFPAAYPNMIAVGSVDSADVKSSFSGFGAICNCAAPGNQTFVTANYDGGYTAGFQGCSYSAPIVAAVAALMKSQKPSIANQEIYNTLTSAAGGDPTTGFTNSTVFRVNAAKALLTLTRPSFLFAR